MAAVLTFEDWKLRLHEGCQLHAKLLAYKSLGDECIRLLWEAGTEPSVQGIIDGDAKTE